MENMLENNFTKQEQELIEHVDAIMDTTEDLAYHRYCTDIKDENYPGELVRLNREQRKATRAIMKWFRKQV